MSFQEIGNVFFHIRRRLADDIPLHFGGKLARNQEAFQRLANGETQADIARTYAVHPATIGRMLGTAGSPFAGASVAAA